MLCLIFEKFFSILPLWSHLLLNLDSYWCNLLKLEINLDFILILNLLTPSWNHSLGIFVIIFVIIKTTWINLIHHHEACFYSASVLFPWSILWPFFIHSSIFDQLVFYFEALNSFYAPLRVHPCFACLHLHSYTIGILFCFKRVSTNRLSHNLT